MERRNFLLTTKSLVSAGALLPLLDACSSQEVAPKSGGFTVDLSNPANSSLQKIGGVLLVQGIFIVRTDQSTYIGLSQICTHQGCSVNFVSSAKEFVCPCHGGVFDINGSVVSGPPPSSLSKYAVSVSGNILTVSA